MTDRIRSKTRRRTGPTPLHWAKLLVLAALTGIVWLLGGCGSGSGSGVTATDDCADCGTLLVTLTDAEGDFVNYTVDVASLKLERANGDIVETLPNAGTLDFTQYVNLTELFTAAQVPAGTYLRGTITLDYTDADIRVEVGDQAVEAIVQDRDGNELGSYELEVELANDRPLIVRRGLPSLLNVDFDLAASHDVDTNQMPPVVTAAPFIVAELEPVDEKDLRARGPLLDVDIAAMSYTIRLRPFHHPLGDFGRAEVHVDADTTYDIDGVDYTGADGLDAMARLDAGTPTVALGTLIVDERIFTAAHVAAGSSVPGHAFDTAIGNILSRDDNELIVKGATIVRRSGSVVFNDTVTVTLGPDTVVKKQGTPGALTIDALSIGQRVQVFGEVTSDPSEPAIDLDATQGRVRMRITHIAGTTNAVMTGQLNIDLQAIDRSRVSSFDFTGTGMSPADDAVPADYEIATETLSLDNLANGSPIQVFGFVRPFGAAPADFEGRTVVDLANRRARLGIGWGPDGTLAPFTSIGTGGLVVDVDNPDIGLRHHIKIGPVVIDLFDLPMSPTIIGAQEGPRLFAILQHRRVQVFRDFDRFIDTLGSLLNGANTAQYMHSSGSYVQAQNTMTARFIGVHIDGPETLP